MQEPAETEPPLPAVEPEPPQASAPRRVLADGERRSLPERSIQAERRAWVITALIFCGLAAPWPFLGLVLGWYPGWLKLASIVGWLALVALFSWLTLRWPALVHRHTAWRLTQTAMDIWKGVLWRRQITIPRSRVQHTDVQQGPLQRGFDIATLTVHTAGHEHAKVTLEGLDDDEARAIRDFLIAPRDDDVV